MQTGGMVQLLSRAYTTLAMDDRELGSQHPYQVAHKSLYVTPAPGKLMPSLPSSGPFPYLHTQTSNFVISKSFFKRGEREQNTVFIFLSSAQCRYTMTSCLDFLTWWAELLLVLCHSREKNELNNWKSREGEVGWQGEARGGILLQKLAQAQTRCLH